MDSVPVPVTAHPDDRTNNKKMRRNPFKPKEVNGWTPIPVIATTPANMLCEDELSFIFSNRCLSTKDLLNFRIVNKSWRDAATSTLLRRNAYYVTLDNKVLAADRNGIKSYFCQLEGENGACALTQLTYLMSKSLKFPASNVHIHLEIKDPNDRSRVNYSHHPDLLMFFKLHGDKIKTLCSQGDFCLEALLQILYAYTPNIQCLDLTESRPLMPKREEEKKENKLSRWTSGKCIPVESLLMGSCYRYCMDETIHQLLTALPKLRSIENVNIMTLIKILDEEKGRLVRSFEYTLCHSSNERYTSALQKFAQIKPKLFKLRLKVVGSCSATSTSISEILQSSHDTLQQLELSICPFQRQTKLQICPMKLLKSIILGGEYPLDDNEADWQFDEGQAYSIFEDGLSASNCFPSLFKLRLTNLNVEQKIMRFFQFKVDVGTDRTVKNCLPKVKVLEIVDSILPTPTNSDPPPLISKFFPNLRVLKMNSRDFRNFKSSFWTLFPSVEFLEIYHIWSNGLDDEVSSFSDKFFTGFSPEMCKKLRTAVLPESVNHTEGLKFLRVTPSVCDMLKNLWAEFASHATGIYAFSQMPRTKFIISYDPEAFQSTKGWYADRDHPELCFASIKPYVEIVQEKDAECAD